MAGHEHQRPGRGRGEVEAVKNFGDLDLYREQVRDYVLMDDYFQGLEMVLPLQGLFAPAIAKAKAQLGMTITCDGFDVVNPGESNADLSLQFRLGVFENVLANRPQSGAAAVAAQHKTLEEIVCRLYAGLNPVRSHALGIERLQLGEGSFLTTDDFLTFEIAATLRAQIDFGTAAPAAGTSAGSQIQSLEDVREAIGDFFGRDDFFSTIDIILPTPGLIAETVRESRSRLGIALTVSRVSVTTDAAGSRTVAFPVRARIFETVSANRRQASAAAAASEHKTLEQVVLHTLQLFDPQQSRQFGGSPLTITRGRYVDAVSDKLVFDITGTVSGGWIQ